MRKALMFSVIVGALMSTPAFAYVGPGTSLGAVGVVLGVIGTVFLTILSLIWYPFKRLIRKLTKQTGKEAAPAGENPESADKS